MAGTIRRMSMPREYADGKAASVQAANEIPWVSNTVAFSTVMSSCGEERLEEPGRTPG